MKFKNTKEIEQYIKTNGDLTKDQWRDVSREMFLTYEFIDKYQHQLDPPWIKEIQLIKSLRSRKKIKKYLKHNPCPEKRQAYIIGKFKYLTMNIIKKHWRQLNLIAIAQYQKLPINFMQEIINEDCVLHLIAKHQKLPMKFIEEHMGELWIPSIEEHQKLSINFLKKHKLAPYILKTNPNLSKKTKQYVEMLNQPIVFKSTKDIQNHIKNAEQINWWAISISPNINVHIIEKYSNDLYLGHVIMRRSPPKSFIKKYIDKLPLELWTAYHPIPIEILNKLIKRKELQETISRYQKLPLKFIKQHSELINWTELKKNSRLTFETRYKLGFYTPEIQEKEQPINQYLNFIKEQIKGNDKKD